ncbi:MAG TPA: sel1 repeat family protein [Pseudomonas xinjiangensis]|uniref:Sel1 repeat family protein n=2 Tax=root TaxID=1 RepID=A0A7V1BL72_9GAMM|nr:sel1 repeat family protein [Halopseudomonas xinjiangensis]HEC47535.1 sel1 repeat family protein [Halopseudomonas xinjiangensis]
MRALPLMLIAISSVMSGCTSLPSKDQIWSRSSAFFAQSAEMLAAQRQRLAEFAGSMVGSKDRQLRQQELDELFAQPYIDPLTDYLEAHSDEATHASNLAKVAYERDQRCGNIANTYSTRDPSRDNLNRMQRGYLYSCPEEVQAFAARVKAATTQQTASQSETAPSDKILAAPSPEISAVALNEALDRKQSSDCYLLYTIKNNTQAFDACRPIAERGDAKAQHHMASLAKTRKDYTTAAGWAELSAAQDYPPGQLILGQLYQEGQGLERDPSRALTLMRGAADQGLAEACYHVGLAYQNGVGTAPNSRRASDYLQSAANKGHMPSHMALASLYQDKQPDQARYWLNQAARKGSADAQYLLADSYAKGINGATDSQEAYVWYSLALLNGKHQAKAEIDRQEKLLTGDQLTAAQSRIQDGINGRWR